MAAALIERARRVMPGGVSSPVRAFRAVGGEPLFFHCGAGARVRTEDGRELLDLVSSWGPLILGHAHPQVVAAVAAALARGTSFGAPCRAELELAEEIVRLSPVAERVRFVSSGTEATMSALRVARAATGRDRVLKFDGCYHGHADPFLVKAGSGLRTFGVRSSAGVPQRTAELTSVLPLDDDGALDSYFAAHGSETAAVILEGVPANCGLLPQRRPWLERLVALARRHGALLVADEVITGFRLAPGGFCGREGFPADLVTYGKVIGGGLPVAAYGGRAELMALVAPEGPVYQAGTLSGNPLGMAAGLATLRVLEQEDGWARLEALGRRLEDLLRPAVEGECRAGHPAALARAGSLLWLCFGAASPPRRADAIPGAAAERYGRFFHAALRRGVYLAPSAYEVAFLNLALSAVDLELAAESLAAALQEAR